MALSDNLISYWKLDEASGNAIDAHGSNDLTDTNTVGSTTGLINDCRTFVRASSEYFTKATNTSLETGAQSYSYSVWFQIDSAIPNFSTYPLLCKGDDGESYYEAYLQAVNFSGTYRIRFWSNSSIGFLELTSNQTMSTATWYYVTVTFDAVSDTATLYWNGSQVHQVTSAPETESVTGSFKLGTDFAAFQTLDGKLDEVGFWKRALTSSEVSELYNSGSGRDYDYIAPAAGSSIPVFANHYRMQGIC